MLRLNCVMLPLPQTAIKQTSNRPPATEIFKTFRILFCKKSKAPPRLDTAERRVK